MVPESDSTQAASSLELVVVVEAERLHEVDAGQIQVAAKSLESLAGARMRRDHNTLAELVAHGDQALEQLLQADAGRSTFSSR